MLATDRCERKPSGAHGDMSIIAAMPSHRLRLPLFAALLLAAGSAIAAPARYAFDPVHTRVMFALSHDGLSQAIGTISGSTGTLQFDPDDWQTATLEVSIPVTRIDLGDAKWNDAALAGSLLDGKRFPEAHFVSTRVEPIDASHARVTGTLTLRGVSREVTLEVTLNAIKRLPLPPFHRIAGFSATTTISRAAFGVDAWKSMIGDEVTLRIEAEAIRIGKGASDDDTNDTPATEPKR